MVGRFLSFEPACIFTVGTQKRGNEDDLISIIHFLQCFATSHLLRLNYSTQDICLSERAEYNADVSCCCNNKFLIDMLACRFLEIVVEYSFVSSIRRRISAKYRDDQSILLNWIMINVVNLRMKLLVNIKIGYFKFGICWSLMYTKWKWF